MLAEIPLPSLISSFTGLGLLLAAHFYARRLLGAGHSSTLLLNISAGIAIAYAFVDVFPHLARKQLTLESFYDTPLLTYLTHHAYLMALLGFCVYVGLRVFKAEEEQKEQSQFAHLGLVASMCLYAAFIGYMLAEQTLYRPEPALLFGLAMAAHFFGVDHTLIEEQKGDYEKVVRYLLMGCTLTGWLCGFVFTISEVVYAMAFAYIAGGIVAVGAISDLPRVRTLKGFAIFFGGVVCYSAVLLLIEGYKS